MGGVLTTILALAMTWTVASKSSVSSSGDIPVGVYASYACTYQKGDVRAGDTAQLILNGTSRIAVQQITLYLQSNKSAGAGTITVLADGQRVVQKSGSLKDWTGAFDNQTYHAVSVWSGNKRATQWTISLVGTENSLHIEKYVVTYQLPPAYSVTLMNGAETYTTLTESAGLAGVVLPALEDTEEWNFIGWTPIECWNIDFRPECYAAGTPVYPTENSTLWALWQHQLAVDTTAVTDLQSGDYIYVNPDGTKQAMIGPVSGDKIGSEVYDAWDIEQVYQIRFSTNGDSAIIYHPESDSYIGYSGTALENRASTWLVFHEGNRTSFYFKKNDRNYLLWPVLMDSENDYNYFTGLYPVTDANLSMSPMILLPAPDYTELPIYTAHPESGLGMDFVLPNAGETIVPFGIYEIHICNGKKSVRLRN